MDPTPSLEKNSLKNWHIICICSFKLVIEILFANFKTIFETLSDLRTCHVTIIGNEREVCDSGGGKFSNNSVNGEFK